MVRRAVEEGFLGGLFTVVVSETVPAGSMLVWNVDDMRRALTDVAQVPVQVYPNTVWAYQRRRWLEERLLREVHDPRFLWSRFTH